MMTDTDTSAEASALITQATAGVLSETAATLRALLARAERAEAERDRLLEACVLASAPLEAMIIAGTDKRHSADVQVTIRQGRDAVRAALKEPCHD
jgi:hypothetical protein